MIAHSYTDRGYTLARLEYYAAQAVGAEALAQRQGFVRMILTGCFNQREAEFLCIEKQTTSCYSITLSAKHYRAPVQGKQSAQRR